MEITQKRNQKNKQIKTPEGTNRIQKLKMSYINHRILETASNVSCLQYQLKYRDQKRGF